MTPVYGLSEAALAVTFSDPWQPLRARRFDRAALAAGRAVPADHGLELVSVGRPLPGFEVAIADGRPGRLAEGRVGRVLVRGPSLMTGYLHQDGATARALRDGWLDTGDRGFLLDGELHLTGRYKDTLIVNGRNHAPEELERGLEIRDCLCWLYGQGFPKSLDISKALDKKRDDREAILAVTEFVRSGRDSAGVSNAEIDSHFGTNGMAGHWTSSASQPAVPTWDQWIKLRAVLRLSDEMDAEAWRLNGSKGKPGEAWQSAEVVGIKEGAVSGWSMDGATRFVDREVKAPATAAAIRWQGYGTALKPAWEPAILAMKPCSGTFPENALAHEVAGLNVDGCRLATGDKLGGGAELDRQAAKPDGWDRPWRNDPDAQAAHAARIRENVARAESLGRWPANVALDQEAAAMLDEQSGERGGGFGSRGAGGTGRPSSPAVFQRTTRSAATDGP